MTSEREQHREMARIIQMSCATRMSDATAMHYADNLVKAGYGKLPDPPARESDEWKVLCQAAENLGTVAAKFQNARDAFVAKYPKDKQ